MSSKEQIKEGTEKDYLEEKKIQAALAKEKAINNAADKLGHGAKHLFSPLPFDIYRSVKSAGGTAARGVRGIFRGAVVNPVEGIVIDPTNRMKMVIKSNGDVEGYNDAKKELTPFLSYLNKKITLKELRARGEKSIDISRRLFYILIFLPQIAFVHFLVSSSFGFVHLSYYLTAWILTLVPFARHWSVYMSITTDYNGSPIEWIKHFKKEKDLGALVPEKKSLINALKYYKSERDRIIAEKQASAQSGVENK